jgi:hypothetical protein
MHQKPRVAQNKVYSAPFGMNHARQCFGGGRSLHLHSPHVTDKSCQENQESSPRSSGDPKRPIQQSETVQENVVDGTTPGSSGPAPQEDGGQSTRVVTITVSHPPIIEIAQPGQVVIHPNQKQLAVYPQESEQGEWTLVTNNRNFSFPPIDTILQSENNLSSFEFLPHLSIQGGPVSLDQVPFEDCSQLVLGRAFGGTQSHHNESWPPLPRQEQLFPLMINHCANDSGEACGPNLNATAHEEQEREQVSCDGVRHPALPPAKVPCSNYQSPSGQRRFNTHGPEPGRSGNSTLSHQFLHESEHPII